MEKVANISGFSLIELVMVMGILLALAIPIYFRWSSGAITLYSQAQLLANDIRYVQNLSMTKHQRFSLVKTSATTYQIQDATGNIVEDFLGREVITLTSGVTFGAFQTITNGITFSSEGVPYDDSTDSLPLVATAVMPLLLGSHRIDVTITPETGMVIP